MCTRSGMDHAGRNGASGAMRSVPVRTRVPEEDTMKLGTSLRFLYPTGPQTYERFTVALAALPPGGFIERPMGTLETDVQAAQVPAKQTLFLKKSTCPKTWAATSRLAISGLVSRRKASPGSLLRTIS